MLRHHPGPRIPAESALPSPQALEGALKIPNQVMVVISLHPSEFTNVTLSYMKGPGQCPWSAHRDVHILTLCMQALEFGRPFFASIFLLLHVPSVQQGLPPLQPHPALPRPAPAPLQSHLLLSTWRQNPFTVCRTVGPGLPKLTVFRDSGCQVCQPSAAEHCVVREVPPQRALLLGEHAP